MRSRATALDASVRASVLRPTAGVVEARALNAEIRRFAQEAALSVGRGMSDWSKRRLLTASAGHDPALSPYLLSSLIASSASERPARGDGAPGTGVFGTGGFGTGGSGASTTFNDSSTGGGGMTGGSGGY